VVEGSGAWAKKVGATCRYNWPKLMSCNHDITVHIKRKRSLKVVNVAGAR
jgi:hypothetical protein